MRMWHVCWNCRFMTKPEKMYDIVNEYKSANLSCPSDQEEFRRAGSFKMTKHDKKWKNNLFLLIFALFCSFLLIFAHFCSFLLFFALFCSFLLIFALFCSFLLIFARNTYLCIEPLALCCSCLLIFAHFCSFLLFFALFCFFSVCSLFVLFSFVFSCCFFVVVCWKNDKMLSTWTRATDSISPDLMGNLDLLNKLLIYMYIYIYKQNSVRKWEISEKCIHFIRQSLSFTGETVALPHGFREKKRSSAVSRWSPWGVDVF